MEWYFAALFMFGVFMVLLLAGMPVAFCFMLVGVAGAFIFFGGEKGLGVYFLNLFTATASFILLPIPLFILMGEVLFRTGVAVQAVDALDKVMGRLPGRLGLLTVAAGTVFSVLTGSMAASTATLGSVLTPEMTKRGYGTPISLGTVVGSGGLAMMIPPSANAIVLAVVADVSVTKVLIGGIVPGLMMALFYGLYIVLRCWLQPGLAPSYEMVSSPLSQKLAGLIRFVLPAGFIIFAVTGVMLLGLATPTEAAATGTAASFILVAAYRRLNWKVFKETLWETAKLSVMVMVIIAAALTFSEVLAASGAVRGLATAVVGLPLTPIGLVIVMQLILALLGLVMGPISMIMVSLPIFMPIIYALDINPVWFALMTLVNMAMSEVSPPFGTSLFIIKGLAPLGTTMNQVFNSVWPFFGCDLAVIALLMAFPAIGLWLPGIV